MMQVVDVVVTRLRLLQWTHTCACTHTPCMDSHLCLPPCSPQLCCRVEGLHEKQKSGPLLPGATDDAAPLITSGDVPAQTCAEDPQVPPSPTGTTATTASSVL